MVDDHDSATPTRLSGVQEELIWFFNGAPGEMGLKSSYPAMIRRLLVPGPRGHAGKSYEMDEVALDASRRARRIARVLQAVDADVLEVLRACFTLPSPRRLKAYGVGAAVVPLLQVTQVAYRASGDTRRLEDWLGRLPGISARIPAAGRVLAALVSAGDEAYWQAVRAYSEERRRTGGWHRWGRP